MCVAAPPPSLRGVHGDSFCRLGCLLLFGTESDWKDQNMKLISKPSFVPSNEFMELYFTSFISPCGLGGGAGFSLFSLLKALRILLVSQHTGLQLVALLWSVPSRCVLCCGRSACPVWESLFHTRRPMFVFTSLNHKFYNRKLIISDLKWTETYFVRAEEQYILMCVCVVKMGNSNVTILVF